MAFDVTLLYTIPKILLEYFDYPWVLAAVIPALIALFIIIRIDFVKVREKIPRKRMKKIYLYLLRSLVITSLLIAIASPYMHTEKTISGDPFMKILVDNSSSFAIFDKTQVQTLIKGLSDKMTIKVSSIGEKSRSGLGDGILRSIEAQESVLLITDGNNNFGAELGDVALYSASINTTLHALKLDPIHSDNAITISGPEKTVAEVENLIGIHIQKSTQTGPIPLTVTIDGQTLFSDTTDDSYLEFPLTWNKEGQHTIVAKMTVDDFFPENNIYYKTIKVVPRPKIFYLTEKTIPPLQRLYTQLYEVVSGPTLPPDLGEYLAVVIDDMNAGKLNPSVGPLTDYVTSGNGLLVVGGLNAYDRGGYANSMIESILPVYVGEAGKEEGEINIVLLIDISGSTGTPVPGFAAGVDIEKALALSVLNDLAPEDKVAVLAFNVRTYTLSELSPMFQKVKPDVQNKIKTLVDGGGTRIDAAILHAIRLLAPNQGSKNIILISDGVQRLEPQSLIAATQLAAARGIKIYSVGVGGKTDEPMMKLISQVTNGIYFRPTQSQRLKILFGDPDDRDKKEMGLFILNPNHFITEGLEVGGAVTGFNSVVPKSSAQLLVTTDGADPLLTAWRFGLGREAALTTDDGSIWGGELLSKNNSKVLTRTANWIIGEPDRKAKAFVNIPDTRVNESTTILVKSQKIPTAPGINFHKEQEQDLYSAAVVPDKVGFSTVLATTFAVNGPEEFAKIGFGPELYKVTETTQGQVFDPTQIDQIVEAVQSKSKRVIITKQYLRMPLLIAAMLLFLLDIAARRVIQNQATEAK